MEPEMLILPWIAISWFIMREDGTRNFILPWITNFVVHHAKMEPEILIYLDIGSSDK
jgi:hypothetical protein